MHLARVYTKRYHLAVQRVPCSVTQVPAVSLARLPAAGVESLTFVFKVEGLSSTHISAVAA